MLLFFELLRVSELFAWWDRWLFQLLSSCMCPALALRAFTMECNMQLHGNKSTLTGLKFSTSKLLSVVVIRSRTVNRHVCLI